MNPDLRCYHHPERQATSQCDRCGDYLCPECVHEHDELHVCARCFEDIRPRKEIGTSGKIACVMNALACFYWMLCVHVPHLSEGHLPNIPMIVSVVAVLLAVSNIRGRASGERLFRWSVMISAGGCALFIAEDSYTHCLMPWIPTAKMYFMIPDVTHAICRYLVMASIVLLGAAAWKRAKPVWALVVALLAPLMFGVCLLTRFAIGSLRVYIPGGWP